ncbi:modification methylase, type III R/M system [Thermosipho africanus Ob7]|uniref:site-specific DNA-methyltransferase n=1 Tax=Thermosipho africanus TaxID=2421 RepID=UPI000E0ABA6F|nr:site-specific DNA-methyltransferase [Thermosipho africanus]RDI91127.1 modification methylase, type III R/M system [Thermosipho africanus Ob7]
MNRYEKEFYDALNDLFIGEEIEGKSGYVNLMKIKSTYYTKRVQSKLQEIINNELEINGVEDFREELFEKLYTFFKRYFSESGSIYYTYTPWSERIYERVYDPEKDVILFWKTHMLYYVKTEKNYKSVEIKIKGINGEEIKFYFDVSELEHKKANEKKEIMFEFKEIDKDKKIVLRCIYSEKGRKTKIDEIVKQAKEGYKDITTEDVEKAIRIFNKQSEVDYFINKDAEKFLKEQLDMYVYQYMFDSENVWSMKRIKEIQVFKKIANKIIEFIAQFENELVKIWNKPKFVFNSNYVITIDRIVEKEGGYEVLEKILNHENIEQQIEEWKELGIVDEGFKKEEIYQQEQSNLFSQRGKINEKYKYLPIDTKYFKDIEIEILELFDDIDEELDGWLIKSENYQALNTILPKFKEKVQTIYIDPPYNTGSDDFVYKDKFQHSSWLTMMENRLSLARELMRDDGVIFVSIDDNEVANLKKLMSSVFEEKNFASNIIWKKKASPQNDAKWLSDNHDYILLYSKCKNLWHPTLLPRTHKQNKRYKNIDNDPRGPWAPSDLSVKTYNPQYVFPIIDPLTGKEYWPPKGRCWMTSKERIQYLIEDNRIYFGKGKPVLKKFISEVKEGIVPLTIWDDTPYTTEGIRELKNLFLTKTTEPIYSNPKPTTLIKKIVYISTQKASLNAIILDFFAGSGTTAHAVMKLNKEDGGRRKFILIEMADYFYEVIIPRIKKVSYSFNWKDGKPTDADGIGVFIKYYELEQYEEVLRNAKYEHGDLSLQPSPGKDVFNEYIFMRSPKFVETVLRREGNEYKVDLSKLYPEKKIDIVETLSNVLGKKIKKISKESFELEDIGEIRYDNIPVEYIKPLIWW